MAGTPAGGRAGNRLAQAHGQDRASGPLRTAKEGSGRALPVAGAAARRYCQGVPSFRLHRAYPKHTAGKADSVLPPAPPAAMITVDALGRKCPIPIIMLAERIREVPIGQIIAVLADDPAAKTDVPAWCTLKSQEFVTMADLPRGWSFFIRRSY